MKTLSDEGSGDALGAQRKQERVRCLGLVFSDLFSTVVPLSPPPVSLSITCPPCSHARASQVLVAFPAHLPTPAAPCTC